MFTTLVRWSGAEVPNDRVMASISALSSKASRTRDGFPFWMGANKGRLVGYSYRVRISA
jgi:hypothetical protein